MIAFDGFKPEDFDGLKGSAWRSRKALGGLLSQQLGSPYESWGVKRRLELHLARKLHYEFDNPWPYAKLFVYSHNELDFGFYVETPGKTQDNVQRYIHWQRFRDRLQDSATMREALLTAMKKHNLVMTDYYQQDSGGALGCRFAFREDRLQQWKPDGSDWRDVSVEHLIHRIAQLPEGQWVNLHIFATMEKEQAIDMADQVVFPIVSVLRSLVPVYEMTISERL